MKLARFVLGSFGLIVLLACVQTEKIKDGYTAYERKRYSQAIKFFERDYERSSNEEERATLSYYLAKSYELNGEFRDAASWYKQGFENGCGNRCLDEFAQMMKNLGQYEQAILAYQRLAQRGNKAEYLRKIADVQNAILWKSKPRALTIDDQRYSTPTTEYPSQLTQYGDLIVTFDEKPETEEDQYYWTGNSFFDIKGVDARSGDLEIVEPYFDFEGNQADLVTYSNIAFFTRCYASESEADDYCKIMVCYKDGNFWSRPVAMPFSKNKINYAHPSYDEEEGVLYFSANLEADSSDVNIYQVVYEGNTEWGEPSLVPNANSKIGREVFPRIYGDTLYFSSDARGLGGLDIFYIHKTLGRWTAPHNLRAPINSSADDFALTLNNDSSDDALGYFASSRRGGKGKDDIYSFRKAELRPKKTGDKDEPEFDTVQVTVIIQERIYNTPDDRNSGLKHIAPLTGVEINLQAFPGINWDTINDQTGRFTFETIGTTNFTLRASKEGYLSNTLNEIVGNRDTTFKMQLEKIFYNQEYVLDNIYFDFDRWEIRPDAEPQLNELLQLLNDNPALRIQMSSHTDCRGTIGYNQDLSQKRARSTVQYLVNRGIDPNRLTARGFGESQPRADCECDDCSEREHQLNRRTAFVILEN